MKTAEAIVNALLEDDFDPKDFILSLKQKTHDVFTLLREYFDSVQVKNHGDVTEFSGISRADAEDTKTELLAVLTHLMVATGDVHVQRAMQDHRDSYWAVRVPNDELLRTVRENDEADEFIDRQIMNRPLPKKVEIWGKRWSSRASGYHRAHIYVDDKLVHVSGLSYGASDQYVQTGLQWLVDNFYIPKPAHGHVHTAALRDMGITCLLHGNDVKRERDTL